VTGDSRGTLVIAKENRPEGVAGVNVPLVVRTDSVVSLRRNLVGRAIGISSRGLSIDETGIWSKESKGTSALLAICLPGDASAREALTYLEIWIRRAISSRFVGGLNSSAASFVLAWMPLGNSKL
jgi:hypothetical protein